MIELVSLLIIVAVSMLTVRIGAIALQMTGLPLDVAKFQAQSAFSGVGFTTRESEKVVSQPVRRRILRILMLMGTAGVTSVIATLVVAFTKAKDERAALLPRLMLVLAGILVMFLATRLELFNTVLNRLIKWALERSAGLTLYDYADLLKVGKGYAISQIVVRPGHWMEGKSLRGLNLTGEGVVVLNVQRANGRIIETPSADTVFAAGDVVICYGRERMMQELSRRTADYVPPDRPETAAERTHNLLKLGRGYSVTEIHVPEGHWMDGRTLRELNLIKEGVLVLNVHHLDGSIVTMPGPNTTIGTNDTVICYGDTDHLASLGLRQQTPEGEAQHRRRLDQVDAAPPEPPPAPPE